MSTSPLLVLKEEDEEQGRVRICDMEDTDTRDPAENAARRARNRARCCGNTPWLWERGIELALRATVTLIGAVMLWTGGTFILFSPPYDGTHPEIGLGWLALIEIVFLMWLLVGAHWLCHNWVPLCRVPHRPGYEELEDIPLFWQRVLNANIYALMVMIAYTFIALWVAEAGFMEDTGAYLNWIGRRWVAAVGGWFVEAAVLMIIGAIVGE